MNMGSFIIHVQKA